MPPTQRTRPSATCASVSSYLNEDDRFLTIRYDQTSLRATTAIRTGTSALISSIISVRTACGRRSSSPHAGMGKIWIVQTTSRTCHTPSVLSTLVPALRRIPCISFRCSTSILHPLGTSHITELARGPSRMGISEVYASMVRGQTVSCDICRSNEHVSCSRIGDFTNG